MTLPRTLLFVPADSPKKMAKARTVYPDGFIFDLEDAVAPSRKAEARASLLAELDTLTESAAQIWVRINSFGSGLWKEDLNVAVHPKVSVISLPKSEDPKEIALIDQSIADREAQLSIPRGRIRLHLILENALGILRAQGLAISSKRVTALSFGAQDYAAEMGITYSNITNEFLVQKTLVAMTAQAFRLQAIGGVFTNLEDVDGLMEDTKRGIREGFTGKTLIHPSQIEPVHRALCPSKQEVAWAQEVVDTFEAAKANGSGVVVVRGRMVDEPILLQATRILRRQGAFSQ